MKYTILVHRSNYPAEVIKLSAANKEEATKKAKALNYKVLAVHPEKRSIYFSFQKKFSLDVFTERFLSLQKAGLNVTQSIEILGKRETAEKNVYENIIKHLREGASLSDALTAIPDVFPPLYIAAVKSSERTSNLVEAMERYLKYSRQTAMIRRRVLSAITYPCVLLALGIVVLFFLLLFVVPSFSVIYDDVLDGLSFPAQMMITMGQFMHENKGWVTLVTALSFAALFFCTAHPVWRKKLFFTVLSIGPLRRRAETFQLSGFFRTWGMLLEGGIPVMEAMKIASELLTLTHPQTLNTCATLISQGISPARVLANANLGDEVAVSLIEAGENSGNIAAMLSKVADFYDTDMEIEIDRFVRLLEPLLMICIGLIIGAVIVLMYFPIFDLVGGIHNI